VGRRKPPSWRYFLLLLLFLLFSILSQRGGEEYLVARVLDGDTIELSSGEKVRYIGIDAPELHHPRKEVQYYAQGAYQANRNLVEGKRVTLELDVEERDRYGRILAYVYVNGVMVNEWLIAHGYAQVATFPPNVKYADKFRALEKEAKANGLGLWAR